MFPANKSESVRKIGLTYLEQIKESIKKSYLNKFKKLKGKKMCEKNHESVLLDLLVTVSELCQHLRISTINSTP